MRNFNNEIEIIMTHGRGVRLGSLVVLNFLPNLRLKVALHEWCL